MVGVTGIELTSVSQPTRPVAFRYVVEPDNPSDVTVTINGPTSGLGVGSVIADNIVNLSNEKQRVLFIVTPYTIDANGDEHCVGISDTTEIWVEPTPLVVLIPQSDTICDGGVTGIELTSVSQPTRPVAFRYVVEPDNPSDVTVTINGPTSGLGVGSVIADNIVNLSNEKQRVLFIVTPYTIDANGDEHCVGISDTTEIWVEPTPLVVLIPQSDTICDGGVTGIELTSVSQPTRPVAFRYVVEPDNPSDVTVTINGPTSGLGVGSVIADNIVNLSNEKQRVLFIVTPYTIDANGDEHCVGISDTTEIWVEPTPLVVLIPQSDTICDGGVTGIELTSVSQPTRPVAFRYVVEPDNPSDVTVTINGPTSGLGVGSVIADNIVNLSNEKQRVLFIVTPYTIDANGDEHCVGISDTTEIWVEPTPLVVLIPQSDTICDGGVTGIELTSVSQPTRPVAFRYVVEPDNPSDVTVTINGPTSGLGVGSVIADNIVNLSNEKQRVLFIVTPYTIDANGDEHCVGISDTTEIWVEPTPLVVLIPQSDTICDGGVTGIELTSVSQPTRPVAFRYVVEPDNPSDVTVTINGPTSGLGVGSVIADNIVNLSNEKQRVLFIVTPYTIDANGDEHCVGISDTTEIWVEPTPLVVLIPQSDTICDGGVTGIEITSVSQPTRPVAFRYVVEPDNPSDVTVTINGPTSGLGVGSVIADNIVNLSNEKQRVLFIVTPYTIDANGDEHCVGISDTTEIWVEPTPLVVLIPQSDTICDGGVTGIELTSVSQPTRPVAFRYVVEPDNPSDVTVTINGPTSGLGVGSVIADNIVNLSNEKQRVLFIVTPYTIDANGDEHCVGISDTTEIWVEPTPLVALIPQSDTICDGGVTGIELTSVSQPTRPVAFRYVVEPDNPSDVSVTINGPTSGLGVGSVIADNIVNLSNEKQRVLFIVTPYTIDANGDEHCVGISDTTEIWVEPTPLVVLIPQSDTICDGGVTGIELTSVSQPTRPVAFRYVVEPDNPSDVSVTINGPTSGLGVGSVIADNIVNLSNEKQRVLFIVTPYTIDANGDEHCVGISDTTEIWVEPTPLVVLIPQSDTICDGGVTGIELTSVSQPTRPVAFRYVVEPDNPSDVSVTINGPTSGLGVGSVIADNIVNLSNEKQRVLFIVTPYTIDANGDEHCVGISDTTEIWVEPTPLVVLIPQSDTICDGGVTGIELTSVSQPTRPVAFRYVVEPDNPSDVTVTINGPTSGLGVGSVIADNIVNLSNEKQRVLFIVTPYTIDANGDEHCVGISDTTEIWVEPTPLVVLIPQSDTICDGGVTGIELTSVSQPTRPVAFRYVVEPDNPSDVTVTINGPTSGLGVGSVIADNIVNLSNEKQRVLFIVTPYTIDANGDEHCVGISDTTEIWVEPTPLVVLIPQSDTICDGGVTGIEITSVSQPTRPVAFRYVVEPDNPSDVTVTINGPTSGLGVGSVIADNIVNLSNEKQRVLFIVTPYTIDANGDEHCVGISDTTEIWVEPTPLVVLIPQSDTICDGGVTGIELTSVSQPTRPVAFRYVVEPDNPSDVTVTINGPTSGLGVGSVIADNIVNLSNEKQRVLFIVTPYTIDANGDEHCVGISDTTEIWVEPTPLVVLIPQSDTICDGGVTGIELTSVSQPTRPVAFRYVVEPDNPSDVSVTINGPTSGLGVGSVIADNIVNLSNEKQRVLFIVTPYTIDANGDEHCVGISDTTEIWVEPTPLVVLIPQSDTICDGGVTGIELTSVSQPTRPVAFRYVVEPDNPSDVSVTINGPTSGLGVGSVIADNIVNLSNEKQRVLFIVTPYTIDANGDEHCVGISDTTEIWVEPTPLVVLIPQSDTICDGGVTGIELTSVSQPTRPVAFRYVVEPDNPSDVTVTINGPTSGLGVGSVIADNIVNLSNEKQRVLFIVTPYTIDANGDEHCVGISDTTEIWVEPTPLVVLIPQSDTICDGGVTGIELTSVSQPTRPVAFRYVVEPDNPSDVTVTINGPTSGLGVGSVIADNIVNLSNEKQRVLFIVTPYTIDANGDEHCVGISDTTEIWVEPTPLVVLIPQSDTICDGGVTGIELTSVSQPTRPVAFRYVVEPDNPSDVTVTINGPTSGLGVGSVIADNIVNLSNEKQRVLFIVTPYTIDANGDEHCVGISDTTEIWVEPTPLVALIPQSDTICDGGVTGIELTSVSQPTRPVAFRYVVEPDNPSDVTVTINGPTSGLGVGSVIADNIVNLSNEKQRVLFIVTPYTIDANGDEHCVGISDTTEIWVEPTPLVVLIPQSDTICDGGVTGIELTSVSQPTRPVAFRYVVEPDNPSDVTVTINGPTSGLGVGSVIADNIVNLSNEKQRVLFIVTPYTIDANGDEHCVGISDTTEIWVEPTPLVVLIPQSDTICDGGVTGIELTSVSQPTRPVAFRYVVEPDNPSDVTVTINGPTSGLGVGSVIADNIVNLSNEKQRVLFIVTPYTIDANGDEHCVGISDTTEIWVEPTPLVVLIPQSDTICDGGVTGIELTSVSQPTRPVAFRYVVEPDNPSDVSVTINGPTSGLGVGSVIADNIVNLSNEKQRVLFIVTPYTIDANGDEHCVGISDTTEIWVEPTARLIAFIDNDTICNDGVINISWSTPTQPTVGIVFNTSVINPYPEISGYTTGNNLSPTHITTNTLTNTGDTARMIMYIITPYLLDLNDNQKCPGINDTVRVWINPTPRVIPIIDAERICTDDFVSVTLTTPTVMTKGEILFDYTISLTGNPGDLTGNTLSATDLPNGHIIHFSYNNSSDTVLSVLYDIHPKNLSLSCENGDTVVTEVMVHPLPLQSIIITNPITCSGGSDGAMALNLGKGSDPHSTYWIGPLGYTAYDITSDSELAEGFYTITATDRIGCQNQRSINLFRPLEIITYSSPPTPSGYSVTCTGDSDGELRFWINTVDGQGYPYSFWLIAGTDTLSSGMLTADYNPGNPDTYRIFGGLSAGLYRLIVIDINGCVTDRTRTLSEPPQMSVELDAQVYDGGFNITCRGHNTGKAWVASTTGGNFGPKTFEWAPSLLFESGDIITGDTLSGVTAGTYYIRVSDLRGCIHIDSITLTEPEGIELLNATLSLSNDGNYNISCAGATDGTIALDFGGGSGTYSYFWTGPTGAAIEQGARDQSGLIAGEYTITVTDLNECTNNYSFTLTQPDPINITPILSATFDNQYNINCNGGTGTIDLVVSGGSTGNYSYLWSTTDGSGLSATNRDQAGLTAGTYRVEVTDINGCTEFAEITLTEPDPIVIEVVVKEISCGDPLFSDGEIALTVSGGSGVYTYLWSNGATTSQITGLSPDTYHVTVTDSYGCAAYDSATLNLPPPLTISATVSDFNGFNISCFGFTDGSIEVTPVTGTPPYIYSWTGPGGFTSTEASISSLIAGTYTLTVIDAFMCTVTEEFILTEPGRFEIAVNTSMSNDGLYNINCHGTATAFIELTGINQTGTATWLWDDGSLGADRSGLVAGTYTVVTTDANLCTADTTLTITEPDPLTLELTGKDPSCTDFPDGEIEIVVTGGADSAPYTFQWSDNSTDGGRTGLTAGLFISVVTDFNGCVISDTISLESEKDICLDIPNAFSPNGDLINDYWNMGFKELYPDMVVRIYNRWGIMVWQSERGYPDPWDGRSNGRLLPVDSYHYVIEVGPGRRTLIGNVTIVR
jgi:gliding motility-associated-like protein